MISKVYGYAKAGEAIFDTACKLLKEPEAISSDGKGNYLGNIYKPKYGVESQYELGKYARNAYIDLKEASNNTIPYLV